MLKRDYASRLNHLLASFPVVTILGPRQSGKTTFIRHALSEWNYQDLEKPSHVVPLIEDPEARIDQLGDHVVYDEAQRIPALFQVLRGVIDRHRNKNGRFVLLGSASPSLIRQISESLAGRTAFLDMPPFRWQEVHENAKNGGLFKLWLRGGFPKAFLQKKDLSRHEWFEAYTRAFIERDLPALGIEISNVQMRKLWTMLAYAHGSIWNASQLASSLGISYHTVNRYAEILEQTFLVRVLPPYFANLPKRLVKSPKIYFRDSGLLHYFLGIRSMKMLESHPSRGASWEGFILDQLITAIQKCESQAQPYYWRTAHGDEADLLMELGSKKIPFEIKLHSSPSTSDTKALRRCMTDLHLSRGYVIYPGADDYSLGGGVMALSAGKLLLNPEKIL